MTDLLFEGSAVFSADRRFRYRLDRRVQASGFVFLFSGINGSTAGESEDDQTTKKWRGFTLRHGGSRYIAINPFAYTATDVRQLALAADPIGPDNDRHIQDAITEADVLVPCWGNRSKVPQRLQYRFADMLARMVASGKPIMVFGLTKSGDPTHPLMLGYETKLQPWMPPVAP